MGLDPRTLGSHPEPKADSQPLSHPGAPVSEVLKEKCHVSFGHTKGGREGCARIGPAGAKVLQWEKFLVYLRDKKKPVWLWKSK